ncbi:uncharacterized protein LOC143446638 isoform X2 [Clavelina lepadiformis]|uniref:uncharacterized protein LOC143446638 isoform X2 n=1 Tax=Clavelina lepadiformis TaxID=159417 RepID=UPI004041357F
MKQFFLLGVMFLASALGRRQHSWIEESNLNICHYRQQRCKFSEFNCRCQDDSTGEPAECIPSSWVCDGKRDCRNFADEIDCVCDPAEFQCYGGGDVRLYQCIDESKVCDNVWGDCINMRDDGDEMCGKGFRCNSGLYIQSAWKCDKTDDCGDNADEIDCPCPQNKCACNKNEDSTCGTGNKCYSDEEKCDASAQCSDGSDERNCSNICSARKLFRCACNKIGDYSCDGIGYVCYEKGYRCDSLAHCTDGSDQWNCTTSCTDGRPLRCACNKVDNYTCNGTGNVCYSLQERCNTKMQDTLTRTQICLDLSDEMNCTCPENTFTCSCFHLNFPSCNMNVGCIPKENVNDGKPDCPSGNDEEYIKALNEVTCGSCDVVIIRLENITLCNSPWCDKTTCYTVPSLQCADYDCSSSEVICSTYCSDNNTEANCNKFLQCSDQNVILNQNFCNGKSDCSDGSDEVISKPGFKCSAKASAISCVLPQWNLYDNIPQCYDQSDLCFGEDGSFHCFKCLDNHLIISPKQVCDGVIDCHDLSDECLCENTTAPDCVDIFLKTTQCTKIHLKYTNSKSNNASSPCFSPGCASFSQNISLITCKTKWGEIRATECDGRPECIDLVDECQSCPNRDTLAFCNDTCHSYFPMGERYCDGYVDEAWRYLKDFNCPRGFDESDCPMRFLCKSAQKVSIDILQLCDGIEDCDGGIDEENCTGRHYCTAKVGNQKSIPKTSVLDGKQDCVDGSDEYIPSIFSSSRNMIGNLGLKIWLWIVTIITILGNFYVVVLSISSLRENRAKEGSACNHFLIINLSISDCLMGVYLMIILVKDFQYSGKYSEFDYEWRSSFLCSFAGSLCVISSQTSCFLMALLTAYRLYAFMYPFKALRTSTNPWKVAADFACRVAALTNTSRDLDFNSWEGVRRFLENKFPQYAPRGEIGYYGTTSVCMPRFYVNRSDTFWVYSISIITLNLFSFMFVLAGFSLIGWKMRNRPPLSGNAQKQNTKINYRITRIIVSDFLCWIPICIMVYVSFSGVKLPDGVEIFTAGVLLPINSAFNPILYSPYIETKVEILWKSIRSKDDRPSKRESVQLKVTS